MSSAEWREKPYTEDGMLLKGPSPRLCSFGGAYECITIFGDPYPSSSFSLAAAAPAAWERSSCTWRKNAQDILPIHVHIHVHLHLNLHVQVPIIHTYIPLYRYCFLYSYLLQGGLEEFRILNQDMFWNIPDSNEN